MRQAQPETPLLGLYSESTLRLRPLHKLWRPLPFRRSNHHQRLTKELRQTHLLLSVNQPLWPVASLLR